MVASTPYSNPFNEVFFITTGHNSIKFGRMHNGKDTPHVVWPARKGLRGYILNSVIVFKIFSSKLGPDLNDTILEARINLKYFERHFKGLKPNGVFVCLYSNFQVQFQTSFDRHCSNKICYFDSKNVPDSIFHFRKRYPNKRISCDSLQCGSPVCCLRTANDAKICVDTPLAKIEVHYDHRVGELTVIHVP